MSSKGISINSIATLLLFVPLILRWALPDGNWEQLFLTVRIGQFNYSWIIICYVLYFLLHSRTSQNLQLSKIQICFMIVLFLCPLVLLFVDNGTFAIELFFSALPFFLPAMVLIARPINYEDMKVLKLPIVFIFIIVSYLFVHSMLFRGGAMTPITFVGDVNASSHYIVIMAILISELYLRSDFTRFILLFFTLVCVSMGACRGAILVMLVYSLMLYYHRIKNATWFLKFVCFLCFVLFVSILYSSNLFYALSSKQEELRDEGDITSGRIVRILDVVENTWEISPLFGVGHGRVFPTSKELLVIKNSNAIQYSSFWGAPHNIFVLTFAEYGIIGLIILIVGLIFLFSGLDYGNMLSYLIIAIVAVMGNTEAILFQDDFWPLFWIIVSLARKL